MIRIDGSLPYYQFSLGVKHAVFTRNGGLSPAPWHSLNLGGTVGDDAHIVRSNHDRIYASLNIDPQRTVTVWQVHGVDTVIANGPIRGRRWLALADGLITDQPGLTLVMRFADCTPIIVFDPARGAIGIAHAGWRGTVDGMAYHLIQAMRQAYGSRPTDIQAGIGPSIGPDRYQVGEEVVEAAHRHFGTLEGLVKRDPADNTAYLNLWEANRRDLQRAGVEHIEVAELCTATRTDEFFSHRAEHGRTGRFGAMITLD